MNKEMRIELAIMFLLVTALGTVWYFGFVKPGDAARAEITRCMDSSDDFSYEGYKSCVKRIQPR